MRLLQIEVAPATNSNISPVTLAPSVQIATASFTDNNPLPVQFFYVPKPEDQLLLALQTIENGGPSANPINPVQTYVSIAATAGGTIIYYDQWEDGYEANIANPTQSTTQIWGDGVLTNGVAPGTSNDLITAGTVLVLNNAVNTNVPVMTDYDGGDKIGATKTVAMARIGWASGSNTLMTTGLEVFDTDNYGTNHIVPVGVDIADTYDFQMFEYTGIFIQAGELGAVVNIDSDADGTIDITKTLAEGQSYLVNGGVHAGARVLSDNPVQVGLMTGDIGSNYESRDAALLPRDLWSNSYYTPVSTPNSVVDVGGTGTANSTATTVWLYNPGTSALNVNYDYRTTAGILTTTTLPVPGGLAGGYLKQVLPDGSGAHFYTTDPDGAGPQSAPDFYAISTTNSTSGNSNGAGNQGWDWGFDLVPDSSLTTQVLIGLGLGRDPTSSVRPNENGMPVWVTPVGNGETPVIIYVDYNGDNLTNSGPVKTDVNGFHYDTTLTLKELERAKVFDPDGDQTGMLLYTLSTTLGSDGIAGTADDVTLPVNVKLAAAWGQDPTTASFNAPGIDTGTGVTPLPTFDAGKIGTLHVDVDTDGFISPGDTLLYTVSIPNTSRAPVLGLLLQDPLSIDTTYVTGTTKINYDDGTGFHSLADSVSGTSFLFDEGGKILGDLAVGKTFTVTFEAKIDAFADLTPGVTTIINTGKVSALGTTVPIQAVNPLYGSIGDFVWTDLNSNGVQDGNAEAGIGGVVLNLYKDANNNSILDGGDILTATKTTDGNGGYLFTGLLAGHYIVDVVDSTEPASYQLTTNNDPKPVNLAGGQDDLQADFGYQPVSSLSGYVYKDAGNDGAWDGAPAGIGGVNVTLAGVDDLGNYIELTTTTLADGSYSFTGLRPSDQYGYTVTETQPSGYFDGKDTAGSTGGNATTINDQINGIVLNAGVNSINNNFGELPPARISGFVYKDAGNDGAWDGLSAGISGVTVTLTGVDDLGNPVNKVTTTNPDGSYDFFNLRPSNTAGYIVTETQPVSFADGKDTAGSTGGNTAVNDVITGILLDAGGASVNNNFGEILPGSLSGFVYVDLNSNGTRQTNPTETPIGSVTLTLTGTTDQGAITPVTTTTNGSGFYQFLNLRPGNYTVTETQPTAYKDGLDTRGNAAPIAGSNTTDVITGITVVSGASTPNNNFGELLPATVSGFVYVDANNNGLKESTETGIGSATPGAGVTVTLTGIDDLGNAVSLNTTTVANGAYSFNSLRPSNAAGYTVTETQPSNYVDGKDTAGSAGGNTAINDVISGIVVSAGGASANNNFGEVLPVSVSGYVYADANDNGIKNSGEAGIGSATPGAGVTVSLTGTNDLGQAVSLSTTTLADGSYSFGNLRPSNLFGYTVTETQPAGYLDGKDAAGSVGGNATVNDKISGIVLLNGGDTSTNNNFGELLPGALSGFVYKDFDNDGVKENYENPVSGVVLTLTGTNDLGVITSVTTTTAADGSYNFGNLRPGTYTVTETQPTGYLDGLDARNDVPIAGSATTDVVSGIVVTPGATAANNNFGEINPDPLSGFVYVDANNNGIKEIGETPLSGVVLTLTGIDDLGDIVSVTTTTAPDGSYNFYNLRPGTFTVTETQPAGYLDGKDALDNVPIIGSANTDVVSGIVVHAGDIDQPNNNFGELLPGALSGFVYMDANNNGLMDSGETPLNGVVLTLTGSNDLGAITSVTATTATDGSYNFANLRPGTYAVTEAQPAGYNDGLDAKNAVPISGSNSSDMVSGIAVTAGATAMNNNFGERPASGDLSITKTDGLSNVAPGQTITYTIVATNTGTANAVNALVSDTMPAQLTNVSWTSVSSGGASGNDASGTGNINDTVNLVAGSSITYTVTGKFAERVADFGAGTDNTSLGQNTTVNGVRADAFYLSSGVYKTTNTVLWERNVTDDHGLGVWSNNEPNPITGGGDVNELSNQLNNEVIRLTKPTGEQWTSLWVSSLDVNGSGTGEKGTLYWSNSATPNLATLTTKFTFEYGDFPDNAEGNILSLSPSGFDASAQYLFFIAGPNPSGTNNDYLVWKASTIPAQLTNTATVTAPADYTDTNLGNNSATDTDTLSLMASVGNRVWCDTDGDGIQDTGEAGVSGVTVKLLNAAGTQVATTTTDTSGNYTFNTLQGDYQVQFVAPSAYGGFTLANQGTNDAVDSDADVTTGTTALTTLAAGVNDTSWDAGFKPVSTKGLVAPTGTTPEQYIRGTAQTFENYYASASGGDFQYSTKSGLISQTNPGLMFYFSGRSGALVADSSGNLIINFVQDNTNSNFSLFDIKNPKLYTVNVGADNIIGTADDSVTNITNSGLGDFTTTDSGDPGTGKDQLEINISGATAGQRFVVSAQYDPTFVNINAGALGNPSVHYNFSTKANGITVEKDNVDSFGVSGVDLVYKAALTLAGDPVQSGHAPILNEADLQQVIDQAISYWALQGTDIVDLSILRETSVQISDLGGKLLAQTDVAGVTIDDDAAGYGWFTGSGNVDLNRVDLLSAVTHELGHVLGYDHDVMDATLAVGERDLPQVDAATTVDATAAAAGVEVEVVNLAEQVSTDPVWMV